MAQQVQFVYLTQSEYDALESKNPGQLYFTSDTRRVFRGDTQYSEQDEYIVGTQTASTASWTGISKDSALYDGKHIRYRLPYAGAANSTLNLTLADGTTTGAKPIYLQGGTSRVSTHFAVGCIIGMTYRTSENSGNGAWRVDAYYDTNTNNYDRNLVTYCKAAAAIPANVICCGTEASGYVKIAGGVTFDLSMPLLYVNGAQTSGQTNGNNWYSNMTTIDIRNTVSGFVSQRGKPLYLLGSVSDGQFTIASSDFLSYTPTYPCIPLGWFNANANDSFCFLPGPLMENYVLMDDLTSGLACNSIQAKSILVNGVPPSLEGHTHDDEYKSLQTAKTSPTASGTDIAFIDTISQNANGEITATKKTVRTASTSQTGVVQLNNTVTSTLTTQAATANVVKTTYDLAESKSSVTIIDWED